MNYELESSNRPATYFLQEAIERGLDAIANRLDYSMDGRPFFLLRLRPEAALEHDIWDLGDMCSRFVDAFSLGRQVTGMEAHRDAETKLRALLPNCDPYLDPFMSTRMIIAYVDQYLATKSPEWRRRVDDLVALYRSRMTFEEDYAYYFRREKGWRAWDQPMGDFRPYPTYAIGGTILALARYTEEVDAPDSADLLDRMCAFVLRESGTFEEDGKFRGHTHSGGIVTALTGVLRRSIRTGDSAAVEKLRQAFDWTLENCTSWGWVPDGLGWVEHPSSETCSIVDAIHAAILLGRHVDPKYFDFAERAVRNQLLENQFRSPDRALPAGGDFDRDAVSKALYGSWASYSLPNSLDNCLNSVEGCCLGGGIRGLFLAWDASIEKAGDTVHVNMAFSRNSPWVEVISYQPFQGRLDLVVHDAPRIRVRLPEWVVAQDIEACINGEKKPVHGLEERYLVLTELSPGDKVQIEYPLRLEETEEVVCGQTHRARWRGDTVVAVSPAGSTYPLYERMWMENESAPLVQGIPYEQQTGGPIHW